MKETYGVALPGMNLGDLVGKLIVVEGTDGVRYAAETSNAYLPRAGFHFPDGRRRESTYASPWGR